MVIERVADHTLRGCISTTNSYICESSKTPLVKKVVTEVWQG